MDGTDKILMQRTLNLLNNDACHKLPPCKIYKNIVTKDIDRNRFKFESKEEEDDSNIDGESDPHST